MKLLHNNELWQTSAGADAGCHEVITESAFRWTASFSAVGASIATYLAATTPFLMTNMRADGSYFTSLYIIVPLSGLGAAIGAVLGASVACEM